MPPHVPAPLVAIACGGTGGHLYPGLAVGESLLAQGCDVAILVSPKEVDQQAVRAVREMDVVTLPAVGLERGGWLRFARGFLASRRQAQAVFRKRLPEVVLAMGGFTSAPPIVAGLRLRAATLLHEANSIPGRANRWLAPWVKEALVYFPQTAPRFNTGRVTVTGMPVRPQFVPQDPEACRMSLGLDARQPVLLVMGGSQGASGVNDLVLQALPLLQEAVPSLQLLHLTGARDMDRVRAATERWPARKVIRPFLTEMELALGAATVAVSRAGASSIAELAALRVPSILIPYPFAADDHQAHNAAALQRTAAALVLDQRAAPGRQLAEVILGLLRDPGHRALLSDGIGAWHKEDAAALVAARVLAHLRTAPELAKPAALRPARMETVLS